MPRRPTADPRLLKIGRRIAAIRAEIGWSQEDLVSACVRIAEARGEPSTINDKHRLSNLENGLAGFTPETLTLLAEALDVRPFELLAGDEVNPYERIAALIYRLSDVDAAMLLGDLQSRPSPRAAKARARRRKT